MMMIARSMDYADVLDTVKGRNPVIWTCGTCAKLCNGIGGIDAAERLADKLRNDGVNVLSCVSVSAACLMHKVRSKGEELHKDADMIISLMCDIGVTCISRAFGKDVLDPLITLGYGFMDDDGSPMIMSCNDAHAPLTLREAAEKKGMSTDPLV